MALKALITTPSAEITASWTVTEPCRVMSQERLGAVAVTESGKVRGIFTYRDLVDRVVLDKKNPDTIVIGDVMTKEVRSLGVDASYGEALRLMVDNDYTYLPIVRENELIGMVSLRDLLNREIDHLAQELDSVTQYIAVDGPGGD